MDALSMSSVTLTGSWVPDWVSGPPVLRKPGVPLLYVSPGRDCYFQMKMNDTSPDSLEDGLGKVRGMLLEKKDQM
jgi:hypothetical protein